MTRKNALDWFEEELKYGKCSEDCPQCNAYEVAIEALKQEPVVHAHWKKKTFNYANPTDTEAMCFVNYACSKCDTTWKYRSHYCPNCGAVMDEQPNKT